jgi:hypothetical protein
MANDHCNVAATYHTYILATPIHMNKNTFWTHVTVTTSWKQCTHQNSPRS